MAARKIAKTYDVVARRQKLGRVAENNLDSEWSDERRDLLLQMESTKRRRSYEQLRFGRINWHKLRRSARWSCDRCHGSEIVGFAHFCGEARRCHGGFYFPLYDCLHVRA